MNRYGMVQTGSKTKTSIRPMDVTSEVAAYLREFIEDKPDKLFPTRRGSYQLAGSLRRRWLDKRLPGCSFHVFRRFRITHLEAARAHGDLMKVWAGHSLGNDVTKHYAKSLRDNINLRMHESEQAGTGFIVPSAPKKSELKAVAEAE